MPDRVDERARLNDALERATDRIATLERELAQEKQQLGRLHAEMAALDEAALVDPSPVDGTTSIRAPTEKLRIYRSLFRGRPDVYPTRFVTREGKQGYGPACANKFVKGKCELPRVKCGECKNQAFLPADDAAYLAHLRADHVMGVYPMLSDEACWFLAVDFDKATWKADVRAFVATCRRLELPLAVERSRSGNGAHVWFFFSAPVAAWAARKLGCYVLTETMAARHELSLDSYDRLFPSQDHMPKGGFGNLIALPLQKEARANGNTELLDDELAPFPGEQQWEVLAATRRPKRRDGHHPIIEMQLGPVRFAVDAKSQAGRRPFEHRLFARETAFHAPSSGATIQELYALLARDDARNRMIVNDVIAAIEAGRSPILLTERIDHLEHFAAALARVVRHVIGLRGGMGSKQTREVFARMAAIPPGTERIVLATGRHIARASTTLGSTHCSSRCRSPGAEPSFSTPGACIGFIRTSARSRSTTTSIDTCRCCSTCSRSGSAGTAGSVTRRARPRLASSRRRS